MLQDSINKFKKTEDLLTSGEKQQISNDYDALLSRAVDKAVEKAYSFICDNVARQLSEGVKDVTGSFSYGDMVPITAAVVESCWYTDPCDQFMPAIDQSSGLLMKREYDSLKVAGYPLIQTTKFGSNGTVREKIWIGHTWEAFWNKLQSYAREDNIQLSATLIVEKSVNTYTVYKYQPKKFKCDKVIESEMPVIPGTYEVSYPEGINRIREKQVDLRSPRLVRIDRHQFIVIKYHYQA